MTTREDQIRRQFRKYHRENPEVWGYFKEFALKAIKAGRLRYSARAIFHRIRWHVGVDLASPEEFKINNNFSPFYVELFEEEFPDYVDFFEKRTRPSKSTRPR